MPVIYIYAINTTAGKDSKLYECPIYRKPGRTELNYIGSIGTSTRLTNDLIVFFLQILRVISDHGIG